MRRAKIVATLGPATSTYEMVRAIIDAGVDVARFNLSHGDYSVHENNFANVRKAAEDAGRPVAILVDLQGPKIRLGKFAAGPHDLAVGDIFKIAQNRRIGVGWRVWVWAKQRRRRIVAPRRSVEVEDDALDALATQRRPH